MYLKLGIDVGGTNTDAVILDDGNHLVAKFKSPTTRDVTTGIERAMGRVLEMSGVDRGDIRFAMLGTTQCINAILERRNLNRVAIIRLGAPATKSIPPLFDWPEDLREMVCYKTYIIKGGHEFDGRILNDLDIRRLRGIASELDGRVKSLAITSVFSPVNAEQENEAREVLEKAFKDTPSISLSHEIGTIGLLERENATTLNAALLGVAKTMVLAFRMAVKDSGLDCELFLGQNDGTLMGVSTALKFPILTVASGPTNSIRGAAFLAGVKDSIVVDIGGTSTDIGLLKDGFPLESARAVQIGGVRTNFRMPDVLSLGIGGGSIVRANGGVTVGPESVGYRLTEEAIIFGGSTLTATDVAVALGRCALGDSRPLTKIDEAVIGAADAAIHYAVETGIDKTRVTPDPLPVVLVGGGSVLVKPHLKGVSTVLRPQHFEVANAIGAAIAEVGGDVDTIITYETQSRAQGIDRARNMAIDRAVASGADRARTRIVNVEEIPITYLPGNAVRVRVKACGDLAA